MKKFQFLLICTSSLFSTFSIAIEIKPENITPAQILILKSSIEQGCKHRGREVGDSPQKVDAFCECISAELNKSMSETEWKDLIIYAASNRTAERDQLLVSKIGPKAAECKK